MSPAHKRFLLLEQGVGSVAFNLPITGGIAFFVFRGVSSVGLWDPQGIALETIGTTFFLPLFTCLIVTPLARRRVRVGAIAPWPGAAFGVQWLPRRAFWRAIVVGVLITVLVAPPTVAVLSMLGVHQQSFWGFVIFKAIFAAVLGVFVTPLIALWAIASEGVRPAAAADA